MEGRIIKLTNIHRLPKTILSAIQQVQSEYSGGSSNLSASSLGKHPKLFWLEKRHFHEVEQDASSLIWSLIGTLIHGLLEKAAEFTKGAKAEERLFAEINGWTFSGQYDLIEKNTLYDYKVTSVWSVLNEIKDDWIFQNNANRWLLHKHGQQIDKLVNVCILRDWQQSKAKFDKNYPQSQIKKVNIPLWELDEIEQFLKDKISSLQHYENTPDNDIPHCDEKSRWAKPTQYAAIKKGGKRATKLFDNPIEAEIYAKQNGLEVHTRKGEDTRCIGYCSVNKFCNYWVKNYGGD